jgi:hypothetical protein
LIFTLAWNKIFGIIVFTNTPPQRGAWLGGKVDVNHAPEHEPYFPLEYGKLKIRTDSPAPIAIMAAAATAIVAMYIAAKWYGLI